MGVVKGSSNLTHSFTQAFATGVVSPLSLPAAINTNTQYSNGTGAKQVDLLYAKQLTLAGTPTSLDLSALTDLGGGAVNMARAREVIIEVVDTTIGHDVIVGDAASNAWAPFWGATGTHTVFAGTYLHISDPDTVGAAKGAVVGGSSKVLKLDPGANTVVVNIVIVGCSAVS